MTQRIKHWFKKTLARTGLDPEFVLQSLTLYNQGPEGFQDLGPETPSTGFQDLGPETPSMEFQGLGL